MQKNIKITIGLLVVVVIVIGIIATSSNNTSKKTFKKDGILYALSVDGASTTSFPSKGLYNVAVTCENATGKWLYDDWKLSIENITGNVSCDIDFTTIEKTYLNDYIIDLATSKPEQGTGEVVNENGYRYEGKNPNNYVWFNDEYWRIIGVFDSTSHGQSNKSLVKIIKEDAINKLSWNTSISNNWETASLNLLINGAYYNAQDGSETGYCYGTKLKKICNYTKKGIQVDYRDMIANVTWYLGGCSTASSSSGIGIVIPGITDTTSNSYPVEYYYSCERGTNVYEGNSTTSTGYIGLMYPSDYGYSVLSSSCARTTTLSSYNSSICAGQSWLYSEGDEWTLTAFSSEKYGVVYVSSKGYVESTTPYGLGSTNDRYVTRGYAVRPVLYLDESVYVIDGEGTLDKPYIIGM